MRRLLAQVDDTRDMYGSALEFAGHELFVRLSPSVQVARLDETAVGVCNARERADFKPVVEHVSLALPPDLNRPPCTQVHPAHARALGIGGVAGHRGCLRVTQRR